MAEPSQRQQLFTAHVPPPRRRNNWIGGGEPVLSHHQPGWTRKGGVRRQSSPMPEPWLTRTWKSDQSDPFLSGQWRETASSFHRDDEEYWSYGDDNDYLDGQLSPSYEGPVENLPSLAHAWE